MQKNCRFNTMTPIERRNGKSLVTLICCFIITVLSGLLEWFPDWVIAYFFVTFRSHGNGVTRSKIFLCAFNSQTQQNPMLGARILVIFRIGYEPSRGFPPRGEFSTLFFLKPQCLLSIFYLFCNLATWAFVSYRGQRSSSALLNVIYQLIPWFI